MRILVVEDDETSNMALMKALEPEHEVFATREAESADLVLQNQRFDLILMDIGLPGMDGITLTELMRQESANRETPVVAVSGMEGEEVITKARDSGFNAFVKKPYSVRSLREIVQAYGSEPPATARLNFRVFQ